MSRRQIRTDTGQHRGLWPTLLLLLAVIVPTVCVLWFMTQAVRNERLAVQQRLSELCRFQLVQVRKDLHEFWQQKQQEISAVAYRDEQDGPGEIFSKLVIDDVVDSVIVYNAIGDVIYPSEVETRGDTEESESGPWAQAAQLEYEQNDLTAAAIAYGAIAAQTQDDDLTARALQAQFRCLAKAGEMQEVTRIVAGKLVDPRYRFAVGPHGRLIVPNVQLLALGLLESRDEPLFRKTLKLLVQQVRDYADLSMPSTQRRFLMEQLQQIDENLAFPTLPAEHLAARYLEAGPLQPNDPVLTAVSKDLWQLPSPDHTVVSLLTHERVVREMQSLVRTQPSPEGVDVRVELAAAAAQQDPFFSMAAGESLPDWRLNVYLDDPDLLATKADKQITAYLWTALLVIVVTVILAVLMARFLLRQMRLTRLKNDFFATVSHELKTPLASMRVLVDTLIEGRYHDPSQATEYLGLIAKENERLTRLIDNFLTFSRMERNKQAFDYADVDPAEVVHAAVEAVHDRLDTAQCDLDVVVAADLSSITADRDALVTVLINLMDNAYKYGRDNRQIAVRAFASDGNVCFEIEDNGIGLARRDVKRIMDRFYQVDQTLSRQTGGCGLGLSIVKFIVEAHGGSINVTSQLNQGSTFTVTFPVIGPNMCDEVEPMVE